MTPREKEDLIISYGEKLKASRQSSAEVVAEAAVEAQTADGEEQTLYIADEIEKGDDGRYPEGTFVYTEEPADNPEAPFADNGNYTIDGESYDVVDGAIAAMSDDSDGEEVESHGVTIEDIRALLEGYVTKDEFSKVLQENADLSSKNEELVAENAALENEVDNKKAVLAENAAVDGITIKTEASESNKHLSKFFKR